jgi:rfaE bifunctional protein kinase chain/domain
MNRYLEFLEQFEGTRVVVLGDYLLDQYIIGNTSRVSREAPIVVIDYLETVHHPGGAANAAQNVAALGAGASALGVVGADGDGETLSDLLARRGVDCSGLVPASDATTSVKLRILAGEMNAQKQQVARVDRSHRVSGDGAAASAVSEALPAALDGAGALLISDYGMGLVPGPASALALERCRAAGIPVVVDSRFALMSYAGATAATPNEVETLEALGSKDESLLTRDDLAGRLVEASGVSGFIVTRGSKGMLVLNPDGSRELVDIVGSNAATDVTGAGDTVAAVVALALACGASLVEAARMATYAAAVVVMKRGTATASPAELQEVIRAHPV